HAPSWIGRADDAESRSAQVLSGQSEVRMIECIEQLCAKLQVFRLGEDEVAQNREIEIHLAVGAQNVDALIAKSIGGGQPESVYIEPALEPPLPGRQVRITQD